MGVKLNRYESYDFSVKHARLYSFLLTKLDRLTNVEINYKIVDKLENFAISSITTGEFYPVLDIYQHMETRQPWSGKTKGNIHMMENLSVRLPLFNLLILKRQFYDHIYSAKIFAKSTTRFQRHTIGNRQQKANQRERICCKHNFNYQKAIQGSIPSR